jgi:acetyl-CoA carboxylase carboxyltransferase component
MPAASGSAAAGLSAEAADKALADQTASAWKLSGKLAYDEIIDPRELRNALLAGLRLASNRT